MRMALCALSLLFAPRSFAEPDRQQQVLFGLLRHTAVSTAAEETGPVNLFFISDNGPIRSEGGGDAGVLQDALDRLRPIHPQRRHALARSWHTKPDLPYLFSIQQVLVTSRMLRRLPKSHGLHVPKRVCAVLATYYSHLLLFIHIFLGELFKKMLCEKEKTAFLLFFGIAFVEIETAPADLHHHMRRRSELPRLAVFCEKSETRKAFKISGYLSHVHKHPPEDTPPHGEGKRAKGVLLEAPLFP